MKQWSKILIGLVIVVSAVLGVEKVYADAAVREPIQTGNAVVSRLAQLQQEGFHAYQQGIERFGGWLREMFQDSGSLY